MAFTHVSYANMPFWGCLPMGMSNYGGDIQIFNMPNYANRNISMMFNMPALFQMNSFCCYSPFMMTPMMGGFQFFA